MRQRRISEIHRSLLSSHQLTFWLFSSKLNTAPRENACAALSESGRAYQKGAETHRPAKNRALDSVRRTSHQQFGRIEKVRGVVYYAGIARQHKDDFIGV